MTWEQMIQKRSLKERSTMNFQSNLKIGFHRYQMVLEKGLRLLSPLEQTAVLLRYLKALPIGRVADHMGMSWDGADELIDRGITKLRAAMEVQRTRKSRSAA
jgi:DNA-directed RNA polymerase specialized sigma24 family protein